MIGHTLVTVGGKSKRNGRTRCPETVATFVVGGIPANVALSGRIIDHVGNVQLQRRDDALRERRTLF